MTEIRYEHTETLGPITEHRSANPNWYRDHVHEMTVATLKRHQVELENKLRFDGTGDLKLSNADVENVTACLDIIGRRLDELLPIVAAQVDDHDVLNGAKLKERWPTELHHSTRLIHYHFCELIFDWNINPFRLDTYATATIDEYAETQGISCFVFTSERNANEFVDFYSLHDFIINLTSSGQFYFLILTNKFAPGDVNEFLSVYKSCMNSIAVLHEERLRAIRNDGGRLGYACVSHFNRREMIALASIQGARDKLGAGYKTLTKQVNSERG